MSLIREWAKRKVGAKVVVPASREVVGANGLAPPSRVVGESGVLVASAPAFVAPAPARVGVAPIHQSEVREVQTVVISKPDPASPDRYAALIQRAPELLPGIAPSHDALKMTARGLDGAEYANWSPNSPYYTKVTDRTAEGDFGSLRSARDRELASGG